MYTRGLTTCRETQKLNTANGGQSPPGVGVGHQGCVQALPTKQGKKFRKKAELYRRNRIQPLSLSVLCN